VKSQLGVVIVASRVLQIDADGCRATGKGNRGITNQKVKNGAVAIRGEEDQKKDTLHGITDARNTRGRRS